MGRARHGVRLGQVPGTTWQSDVTIFNPDPSAAATYSVAFLDARNPSTTLQARLEADHPLGSRRLSPRTSSATPSASRSEPTAPSWCAATSRPWRPSSRPARSTTATPRRARSASRCRHAAVSGLSAQAASAAVPHRPPRRRHGYTNIGLVNLKTDWSQVRLDFLDAAAPRSAGDVDMPPYQSLQFTRLLAARRRAGLDDPLYTVRVKILLPGGAVFPYATVIDVTRPTRRRDRLRRAREHVPRARHHPPHRARTARVAEPLHISNPSTASRKATISSPTSPATRTAARTASGPQATSRCARADALGRRLREGVAHRRASRGRHDGYPSSFVDVSPAAGDPNQDPLLVLGETYNDTADRPRGSPDPGLHRRREPPRRAPTSGSP